MPRQRRTNFTTLIVGEGDAECCFLSTVKEIYIPRDCGVSLKIYNGHGYGGKQTLDRAFQEYLDFDACGVLVDTDAHWDDEQRKRAKDANILPFENTPCLEALLLEIIKERPHGTSQANKKAFERRFGCKAHEKDVIEKNYTRETLEEARNRIAVLDRLLKFLKA